MTKYTNEMSQFIISSNMSKYNVNAALRHVKNVFVNSYLNLSFFHWEYNCMAMLS